MRVAVTTLAFCVAGLLALGMVMLYRSSMTENGTRLLRTQLIWCGLGLVACVAASSVDYRILKKLAWPIFIVVILLLAMLFVPPFGVKRNGAVRWLGYHKTSFFQPSELAKIALIIVVAW